MTHLSHGHGTEHAYVTGTPAVEQGHGAAHGYVTASAAEATPHTDAVYLVHHSRSLSGMHPALAQSPGEGPREASETLKGMLGHLGHPDADYAFVIRHPRPERGRSTPVYSDGDPGVALHPQHWTNEYLAHEAAHLMENHVTGREVNTSLDDHGNHGPGFQGHMVKLLNHLSPPTKDFPGAGDEFPEHVRHHAEQAGKTASRKCPCGTGVMRDGDEWVHLDGSISHDGEFYDKSVAELMKSAARQEIDERSAERGQGSEWRDSLPPEHDDLVQAWERAPGEVGTGKVRNQFRKIISTAPEVQGPVYRGDQPKGCFYKGDFEKKHQPGHAVNFPRWSSTSTRPEVAAGFGRVVYEIHDHGARAIGNTLHEGVMPPGKYRVHSAEWRKAPTRAAIDGRTMHDSEHLHVVLHPAESKGAARVEPHERLFGRTYGLDHRLFEGEQLRPEVRQAVVDKFDGFAARHGFTAWRDWGRLVFFGSEASEWTSANLEGNGDFDLSFGIDYPAFRKWYPQFDHLTDAEVAQDFTDRMHAELNDPAYWIGSAGPFDQTWFCNEQGYDIAAIRPYAAYDVVMDSWIVKPPHLPDWDLSKFPEGKALRLEAHAVEAYVRAVLALPEPYRSQQGAALWDHLHGDRSRAFGPQGEGWYDPANVIEKWLDQLGLWEKLVEVKMRTRADPSLLNAPTNWSNNPS